MFVTAAVGGVLLGLIGTLIGAGGGFLLVPLLALLEPHWSTTVITAYSLAVVTANATVGALSYRHAGRVDQRDFPLFSAAAIPGAILGAYVTPFIPRAFFDPFFGVTLLIIAGWLLTSHTHIHHTLSHTGDTARKMIARDGKQYVWSFNLRTGVFGSLMVGFFSSLLGIGGGIAHVPFMVSVLGFPEHIATATSHAVLAITSAVATIVHIAHGDYRSDWRLVLVTCSGSMLGAPIGAYLSSYVSGTIIMRILALAIAFVGLRLLFSH